MTTTPDTTTHPETGYPYVPEDWHGNVTRCTLCGNPAPDVKRVSKDEGVRLCTPCFIGGVVVHVANGTERNLLMEELEDLAGY